MPVFLSQSYPPDRPAPPGAGQPRPADWALQPAADGEPQPLPQAKRGGRPANPGPGKRGRNPAPSGAGRALGWALNSLLLLAGAVSALAWLCQDRLPAPKELLPDLAQAPVQTPLQAPPFEFSYRSHDYEVKTFADYELWGVIVSHNNISGVGDIYHDADSLDTKDICVLWGGNTARDDYLRVSFSSGAWTCYYEYPAGVTFNASEVSNNHLITDSPVIRKQIDGLRRGDQVHLRGRLVGYRDRLWGNFWRNSSLTRADSGNGACEVVFVDDIEVLKPANPQWRAAFRISGWAALALLIVRALLFLAEMFRPVDERLSRPAWKNK